MLTFIQENSSYISIRNLKNKNIKCNTSYQNIFLICGMKHIYIFICFVNSSFLSIVHCEPQNEEEVECTFLICSRFLSVTKLKQFRCVRWMLEILWQLFNETLSPLYFPINSFSLMFGMSLGILKLPSHTNSIVLLNSEKQFIKYNYDLYTQPKGFFSKLLKNKM